MHKRKETGKIQVVLLLLLLVMAFAGCGRKKGEAQEPFPQEEKSCLIEEDSDYLYLCGSYQLLKINKATGASTVLWENKKDFDDMGYLFYSTGQGLLIDDRLYFIESYRDEESDECMALSVICTDGTGYRRLRQLDRFYSSGSMALIDDTLYVDAEENGEAYWLCYQLQEDGSLSESGGPELEEPARQGYSLMSYTDNGRRKLFLPEAEEKFGCLVLRNRDYEPVKINPETGEEEKLPAEFSQMAAYNEENFLCVSGNKLYLGDNKTFQINKMMSYDDSVSYINVIAMDEEYAYLTYAMEDERNYVFEKVSLETGDRPVIFEQGEMPGVPGVGNGLSTYLSDIVVKNGYLYYVGAEDYQLYMMRRSLENPSGEEKLGEAFYDSGIGEVGAIQSYYERTYSRTMPDILLTETDLEWLQVDGRFAGADKINRYLEEEQNKNIENESGIAEWMEEMIEEYGEAGIYHCSYSSSLSEIAWFDGQYLSFCQQEYDYQGGAHGMPLWIGYTFDLQTGERLSLSDVVANSEEELSSIVTEHFAEYINENPEEFWEDALTTVRDEISFTSDFYLTEDGIKFYFPPYALACYAGWFQEVTIPYDEFEMRISLQGEEDKARSGLPDYFSDRKTYWTVFLKDYQVLLMDLIPDKSLQLVIRQGDRNIRVAKIYRKEEDYKSPDEFTPGVFENLLGHDGFYIYDCFCGMWNMAEYYAVEDGELICLAESWGGEPSDYMVDVDGDGVNELICNVTYIADGAQRTVIYDYDGEKVLRGSLDDLLDVEYDSHGVWCEWSVYLPDENVVEICFWKDEIEGFAGKKYKVETDKIVMEPYGNDVYGAIE